MTYITLAPTGHGKCNTLSASHLQRQNKDKITLALWESFVTLLYG